MDRVRRASSRRPSGSHPPFHRSARFYSASSMSGFFCSFGSDRTSREEVHRSALAGLQTLGGDEEQVWLQADAGLAVSRKSWQLSAEFSGPVLVHEEGELALAVDASFYAIDGLLRSLKAANEPPAGNTPSHLIAAAYRAWGHDLVQHLNGDYAFVIWDRTRRRVFAARDPMGSRPMFWTRVGSGVALSSSSRVLAELTGSVDRLNLESIGALCAGLTWSAGLDTPFLGVEVLAPGHRLSWEAGDLQTERFWWPRSAPDPQPIPHQEAAEELRHLLECAVADRLGPEPTTVWMSGGWDSTAVFAAGMNCLRKNGRPHRLVPVSIAYPEGDPGYEDPLIRMVADHWDSEIDWLPSEKIPLLDRLEARAAESDEPPAHLYELWNRALGKRTRACGARVALDGNGGDQLFAISDVVLADYLRRRRFGSFLGHAKARRAFGRRHLLTFSAMPLVPSWAFRAAERVSGRFLPWHYLERRPAPWIRSEFIRRQRLRERDLASLQSGGSSRAHDEGLTLLTMPVVGWNMAYMRGAMLREGVEVRSPLLDPRVVEFALSRPVTERTHEHETKILLRSAMKGLLPPAFLAPRPFRTGITVGYSKRRMAEMYPMLLRGLLKQRLRIVELGIVDRSRLEEAAERWEADNWVRVNLFNTMRVEFWLRGLESRRDASAVSAKATLVAASPA
ncbi:MAG: hypothetical protein GEU90_19680 [Gemmatimonas sp.]|nr:hypothetical protein [Gemmatimonas sp.]